MVSTWVVLRDLKPNWSATWCRIVILCTKEALNSYISMSFDAPSNSLSLLCTRKTMRNHWFACCGFARCILRASWINMTLLYDFVKIDIFTILLNKFDSLTKHHFRKKMNLVWKIFKFPQFLKIFQFFAFCPGIYSISIIFTTRKLTVAFRKFQNDIENPYFLQK